MRTVSVNGVNIRTTKAGINSIINSLVVFSDGSTYNTATGDFQNRGEGDVYVNSVKLGSPGTVQNTPPAPAPAVKNLGRFNAHTLDLSISAMDAEILPWDEDAIEVSAYGLPSRTGAIDVSCSEGGGVTVIEKVTSRSGSSFSGINVDGDIFISGNGNFMVSNFGSGATIISGGSGANRAKLTIKVPRSATITVQSSGSADIKIGDVMGTLVSYIHGSGDIDAGRMASVSLNTHGSGDTCIASVSGTAYISIHGSGGATIDGGEVSKLYASVYGSGNVKARVTAAEANLGVRGSGNITVDRVVNEPRKSVRGSGRIRVRQVG